MQNTVQVSRVLYKSISCLLLSSALLSACQDTTSTSSPSVTEVGGTRSKRQSIGNCWLYSQASWLESLYFSNHNAHVDVSESYWTYWDWYTRLTQDSYEELGTAKDEGGIKSFEFNTGGSWNRAVYLMSNYGFLSEAQFGVDDYKTEKSALQAAALVEVQKALLEGGELFKAEDRTKEKVTAFLNKVFKVNMDDLLPQAVKNLQNVEIANGPVKKVLVEDPANSGESASQEYKFVPKSKVKVAQAIQTEWRTVGFPSAEGVTTAEGLTPETIAARRAIFKRVMRALNDRQPVLMSVHVFFNGLRADPATRRGIFDYNTLSQNLPSLPADQGGHMVLLTDYTVKNAPGVGNLGRGDKSEEEKLAALEGELATFVSKNSWGFARGPRGLFDGESDFTADYLTLPAEKTYGEEKVFGSTVSSFVLPRGY
ncbi:MAG TPA: hypothetical protein VFO10_29320 [Oligoflexus sp.]|uniref:hypothetical protein n=1 Tax=Oligoflexus sp. TaxID=1971216 RepID=UPI002D80C1EC|nr:hypothetical protein [Oligoflexus sp.]HET9241403.1 hypothetical protein [Oligoflexus sp.]